MISKTRFHIPFNFFLSLLIGNFLSCVPGSNQSSFPIGRFPPPPTDAPFAYSFTFDFTAYGNDGKSSSTTVSGMARVEGENLKLRIIHPFLGTLASLESSGETLVYQKGHHAPKYISFQEPSNDTGFLSFLPLPPAKIFQWKSSNPSSSSRLKKSPYKTSKYLYQWTDRQKNTTQEILIGEKKSNGGFIPKVLWIRRKNSWGQFRFKKVKIIKK